MKNSAFCHCFDCISQQLQHKTRSMERLFHGKTRCQAAGLHIYEQETVPTLKELFQGKHTYI